MKRYDFNKLLEGSAPETEEERIALSLGLDKLREIDQAFKYEPVINFSKKGEIVHFAVISQWTIYSTEWSFRNREEAQDYAIHQYTEGPCALIQQAAAGKPVPQWSRLCKRGFSVEEIVELIDEFLIRPEKWEYQDGWKTEKIHHYQPTVLRADDGRFLEILKEGGVVQNYLSTTMYNRQVFDNKVRYKITEVTEDSGKAIFSHSKYEEGEWLFRRNSRFSLIGREEDGTYLVKYEGRG